MTEEDLLSTDYTSERSAAFSTGIGLARLYLRQGRPDDALDALDKACDKVDELTRALLRKLDFSEELIESFLGIDPTRRIGG